MYLRDHKRHCTTDTVTFPLALYAAVPAALRLVEYPGPLHVLVGAVGGRVGCSGARRLQQQRAAEGGLGQGVQHPGAGRGLGPHTAPEQDIYTQIRLLLSSHPQYLHRYLCDVSTFSLFRLTDRSNVNFKYRNCFVLFHTS